MQMTHVYLEQVEIFVDLSSASCDPSHSGYTVPPSAQHSHPLLLWTASSGVKVLVEGQPTQKLSNHLLKIFFSACYISMPCKTSENQNVHTAALKALGRAEAVASPLS